MLKCMFATGWMMKLCGRVTSCVYCRGVGRIFFQISCDQTPRNIYLQLGPGYSMWRNSSAVGF
ncbi:hypothetical protein KC19_11G089900 [Ceratodon purpureus]|uniref:Secreted protein n=1 Tax=Ceratodon purpureus TaxID=3225 RepID=A0A8T0GGP1_CERPU|nr:hypothetical protein KC19_11G089900 [Ceratodon purpureus]